MIFLGFGIMNSEKKLEALRKVMLSFSSVFSLENDWRNTSILQGCQISAPRSVVGG